MSDREAIAQYLYEKFGPTVDWTEITEGRKNLWRGYAEEVRAVRTSADSAALAEIRQLLAEGKFTGNYLIGMIEGIAKHGPTQVGQQS
jgi:hypothetical protein